MDTAKDPYRMLGVGRDAVPDDIRRAYRRRIRSTHPDVGGDPVAAAAVNEAYRLLSDPQRRADWDAAHPVRPAATSVASPVPGTAPPRTASRTAPVSPPVAAPQRPTRSATDRSSRGRRLAWAAAVVVLVAVMAAAMGPPVDGDAPFGVAAGDCIDLDAPVAVRVPCDSARSDGRVAAITTDPGACPAESAPHLAMGGVVHCVLAHTAFSVRGCVAIEGSTVQPTPCGPDPDGVVSAIVADPSGCPLGTDAVARVDASTHVCLVQP